MRNALTRASQPAATQGPGLFMGLLHRNQTESQFPPVKAPGQPLAALLPGSHEPQGRRVGEDPEDFALTADPMLRMARAPGVRDAGIKGQLSPNGNHPVL